MGKDLVLTFHFNKDISHADAKRWAEAIADREHLNLVSVELEECDKVEQ